MSDEKFNKFVRMLLDTNVILNEVSFASVDPDGNEVTVSVRKGETEYFEVFVTNEYRCGNSYDILANAQQY